MPISNDQTRQDQHLLLLGEFALNAHHALMEAIHIRRQGLDCTHLFSDRCVHRFLRPVSQLIELFIDNTEREKRKAHSC